MLFDEEVVVMLSRILRIGSKPLCSENCGNYRIFWSSFFVENTVLVRMHKHVKPWLSDDVGLFGHRCFFKVWFLMVFSMLENEQHPWFPSEF